MRRSIVTVAAVLGIASFVLNVALIGSNPVATFYLPFTRAFELLLGAVLACRWDSVSQSGAASNWRAWLGIALIAAAAVFLDSHSAFPGWWALLPVVGTALLISAPSSWLCRRVLSSPPLVWIGLISYPLYLWHWPLLVFFAVIKFAPLTLIERELILLATVPLAWATYRFVEMPIRFGKPSPRKIAGLCTAMVLVALAGAAVVWGRGFDFRLPAEIRAMAGVSTQPSAWRFRADDTRSTGVIDGTTFAPAPSTRRHETNTSNTRGDTAELFPHPVATKRAADSDVRGPKSAAIPRSS
jgi:peptidoglycan/LPS O-acetylase OafA/YrhL